MSANSKARSPENTQITVNMPRLLEARIKAAADFEGRKVAPWVVYHLTRLLDARDQQVAKEQAQQQHQQIASRSLKANSRNEKADNSAVADRR